MLGQPHTEAHYVPDSFLVAVCHKMRQKHLGRIPRCKLLTGRAYHGGCASKHRWFYGLRVQVATSDGLPVKFYTHAGAAPEQTGQRGLVLNLPAGSQRYTDAGYTDYVAEDLFNEASGNQQQTARRQNSKRPHLPAQRFLMQCFRKGIETCFGQLTARFPKQIHAVTAEGFASKIVLFIFAHAFPSRLIVRNVG